LDKLRAWPDNPAKEIKMPQTWYGALCPHCRYSTALLEITLKEMIRDRQVATTGEPYMVFVCPRCTKCFEWHYGMREPLGQFDALARRDPVWVSILAKCEKESCTSGTELIAIRPHGTTEQQILDELPTWNTKGIFCEMGHAIVSPRM
jgi:hypothetical protein